MQSKSTLILIFLIVASTQLVLDVLSSSQGHGQGAGSNKKYGDRELGPSRIKFRDAQDVQDAQQNARDLEQARARRRERREENDENKENRPPPRQGGQNTHHR